MPRIETRTNAPEANEYLPKFSKPPAVSPRELLSKAPVQNGRIEPLIRAPVQDGDRSRPPVEPRRSSPPGTSEFPSIASHYSFKLPTNSR